RNQSSKSCVPVQSNSSEPSGQSRFPSQYHSIGMHFSLWHRNHEIGQNRSKRLLISNMSSIVVFFGDVVLYLQSFSSDPSLQSWSWSHTQSLSMQTMLGQVNSFSEQGLVQFSSSLLSLEIEACH